MFLSPKKTLLLLAFFLFLSGIFFLSASTVVNARDCDKPTDFSFSNIVSAFIDPDSDCSMDYFKEPDSKVFRDWIKYSEVSCIRNIELSPRVIGDLEAAMADGELFDSVDEAGGDAKTGLQNLIPNIGLKASTIQKDVEEKSTNLPPSLTSITTSYEQFNIGQEHAGRRALKFETLEEYMKHYKDAGCYFETEDGQGFINDFCESGFGKIESPLEQYQRQKAQKNEDNKCAKGNPEEQWHCQNSYNVGTVTTNVEITTALFPPSYEDYADIPPPIKSSLAAATQNTKARTMVCVALVPNIERSYEFLGIFGDLWHYFLDDRDVDSFGSRDTKIACGDVQGLVGTIDGVENEYRVYNHVEVKPGVSVANEMQAIKDLSKTPGEDDLDIPPPPKDSKYLSRDMKIWEKIKSVGSSCRGPQDNYKQFSGGNTESTSMGDPYWLFRLFNLDVPAIIDNMQPVNPYSLFFLSPGDFTVLEYMTGRNAYSPYRSYLTLDESKVLDNKENNVDIINYLTQDDGASEGIQIGWWPEEEEKYNPETDQTETIVKKMPLRLKYGGSGQLAMHQRGGQQAQNFLEHSFQMMKPLDDRERIDECSLYDGLKAKISDLASRLGLTDGGKITGSGDDCRPSVSQLAAEDDPSETGVCKQWLFENNNYDKVIAAASSTTCNGQSLSPYWAMTIALNENGGLMSNDPQGKSTTHFGCDIEGRAGFETTVEDKLRCMVNSLQGYCTSGMSEDESLAIYGYPPGYEFGPMKVLLGSNDVPRSDYPPLWGGSDQGNLVQNLLGADWASYYSGVVDTFCPGSTSITPSNP